MSSKVKILLAEDDDDDFNMFVQAMGEVLPTCNIVRVCNGAECLKMLRDDPQFDLVFLDLKMPLKNGLESLKSIKSDSILKELRVIIYSESHMIKDIDFAYKNGAILYLVKPRKFALLVRLLKLAFSALGKSKKELTNKQNFVIIEKTVSLE